ncbi:hypothetical protein G7046_g7160 [Stylonectria norvegica]|nr:hypothetical protein G7046_g7160 [Stylonectria norvegica]
MSEADPVPSRLLVPRRPGSITDGGLRLLFWGLFWGLLHTDSTTTDLTSASSGWPSAHFQLRTRLATFERADSSASCQSCIHVSDVGCSSMAGPASGKGNLVTATDRTLKDKTNSIFFLLHQPATRFAC